MYCTKQVLSIIYSILCVSFHACVQQERKEWLSDERVELKGRTLKDQRSYMCELLCREDCRQGLIQRVEFLWTHAWYQLAMILYRGWSSVLLFPFHVCQGSVEIKIASQASPSPKGSIKGDPDRVCHFLASYQTGEETITKSFAKVSECCLWINKMDVATTAGALRKGLEAACKSKAADSASQPNPCFLVYTIKFKEPPYK